MRTKEDEQYLEYLKNHISGVKKGLQWLIDNHIVKDDNGNLTKQVSEHCQ